MGVNATDNNMGLFSKMKLTVDEKTGKMTGAADVFAQAAQEMYDASIKGAEKKESEKQNINDQIKSLSNLQLMVEDLQGKSAYLFNSDKLGNYGVFSNMYANYSSSTVTPVESLIDINLSPDSNLQEFSLEVIRAASYDKTNGTAGFTSSSSALGWAGDLTLNGTAVNITAGMSLTDIRNQINRQSTDTHVKATIIQVSSTDYRLSLQSTVIGTKMAITNTLTGTTAGQIPADSATSADNLKSKFKFNGIEMTRSTNSVDDIVKGLTVVIKKAEEGCVMNVRISPDTEGAKSAIKDWVKSLNTLIDEVAKNRTHSLANDEDPKDSLLMNSEIIQTVNKVIKENMAMSVSGAGTSNFKYLEQIGITSDYVSKKLAKDEANTFTGKLEIDEQVLDEALKNNFDGVRKMFEFQNEISNSHVEISDHPATVSSKIIADSNGNQLTTTLNISRNNAGLLSASITINGGEYQGKTFAVPNDKIKLTGDLITIQGGDALDGTGLNPFKGFEFLYVGASNIANNASDSSTIKFTQGFGDRLSRNLKQVTTAVTGDFARQKDIFAEKIKTLDKAIEVITERSTKMKERFQADFARLESFRQSLAPIMSFLEAFKNSGKS